MGTPAPTKYVVLTCPLGKYTWWPGAMVIEFTPKGRHKPTKHLFLISKTNNEVGAVAEAIKHLTSLLKDKNGQV